MTTVAPADNSPYAIINDAMKDAGKLFSGQTPTGEQYAEYMRRLRDIVNAEQTQGLKLWVNEDITVLLVAGQAAYTFKPAGSVDMVKPLRVLEGFYLFTATNTRRPLTPMALRDYWLLGQAGTLTANQGTISQYLVEKQATQLKVTFWQCPNDEEEDNGAVHLLMQTQITNPYTINATMLFPIEWRPFLHWALASELATGQPESVIARCDSKAAFYRDALENWDVEDAPTSFQMDSRGGAGGSSFS